MIKKTLILAALFLVMHALLISELAPAYEIIRHQWQYNRAAAEKFIYSERTPNNVLVGSSLSQRIKIEDQEFFNLSFSGLSSLDGLRLILQRETLPKKVLVETNLLTREEDPRFTEALEEQPLRFAREHVLSLREGRHPMDWFAYLAEKYTNALFATKPVSSFVKNDTRGGLEKIVAAEKARHSIAPDPQLITEKAFRLKQYVNELKDRGTEVVFYEMPVNEDLCDLILPKTIRQQMHETFPPDQYTYIPQPDCSGYQTSDGVHLTADEAERYSKYLHEYARASR